MGNNIAALKSDASLLEALHKAATRRLTPEEVFEQRVSFVFGSIDSDSSITREQVKQVISEQEGGEVGGRV
jgi:SpoU rRNA methylase family enzyme